MKSPVKNYLSITKTEWSGIIVLVILIGLVLAIPHVSWLYHKDTIINFKDFEAAAAQLNKAGGKAYMQDDEADSATNSNYSKQPVELFHFNPNHLSAARWQKLGLSERQIKGIKNYEAKGGRFYTKADVQKMYTLSDADYRRLEPYIDIPAGKSKENRLYITVELNTADSAELTRLRGIGPGFAMRIIRYRQRLGGFHSKQQLKEVFGFDEGKYADVKDNVAVNARKVHKIDINRAELDELKDFPYFTYKQANAVIQYRKQHGNYESLKELHNIAILDDEILRKIAPYFVFK
ncbi:helix-hairpin-helix domain-containing protein [Mucilaginibacter sp. Bleaf8]|uniref:helix-hairpin-helix domain-containing protein n=1 Tax=Mucilaginibacter sp. Bleaf8 TaxID=2834430 RepID=UPI001BD19483|nr:helix-hairpin-helix domain-containing protein [Mucilaginibacter sp. Bleaf8]MBS7566434.1 helix-hairpin-helix domain-containing protein [Mucilaginibacter sp. Bleaf8]